ncbi:MAG: 2OG-Fe(II) oxygenase [Oceanospirillaceae bacterium]|nr:2OG-Fe(II) oxygenase [Oceanospirillaceae bacterium]
MNVLDEPTSNDAAFYVVAHEPGAESPNLPTWAPLGTNPMQLQESPDRPVTRKNIPEVPGAFQLLNVFSAAECQHMIEVSESLGYLPDAPVSLPRSVRHNDNVTMIVDQQTDAMIWHRVASLFSSGEDHFNGLKPLGLNARFRFYKYNKGDFFKPHTDGSWPGSRVIDGELVTQAYQDRWSQMSFLIYLSDEFVGGATQFLVHKDDPRLPARLMADVKEVNVRTPSGGVLVFPHGQHPMHCLHSSEPIERGLKYIIRTDVLFEI